VPSPEPLEQIDALNRGQPAPAAAASGERESGKPPPQRQRVIEAVLGAGVQFWHDDDGNAYCTVPLDGGELARFRVRSHGFRLFVRFPDFIASICR